MCNLEIDNYQKDILLSSLKLFLQDKLDYQKQVSQVLLYHISSDLIEIFKDVYDDCSFDICEINSLINYIASK